MLDAWKVAKRFRALDLAGQRDVLDLFTKSAGDMLDRWFESAPIKAAFGFDAVVGNFASPYTPGSAYVLLHHVFGEVNGKRGQWGHARGGMGAITQAMAAECARARRRAAHRRRRGARDRRRRAAPRASSSRAAKSCARGAWSPTSIRSSCSSSWSRPSTCLPISSRASTAYRCGSGTFRMNVALSELPDFTALPGTNAQPHHGSGIIIAPSLAYMERAYFDARTRGWSQRADRRGADALGRRRQRSRRRGCTSRACSASTCIRISAKCVPGRTWDDARDEVADLMIDTVNRVAPNFRASVLGRRALTPLDLEREFGLVGGDIFHGALALDQLFSARPVLGHGNYRTPVRGLYMCGAGAHPGGGVTGDSGAQRRARDTEGRAAPAVLSGAIARR